MTLLYKMGGALPVLLGIKSVMSTRGIRVLGVAAGVAVAGLCAVAWSQSSQTYLYGDGPLEASEFHFTRLAYQSGDGRGFGRRGRWLTDWPEAEENLLGGVHRLTRIEAGKQGRAVAVMDDELFDYPWLYAVEVGYWYLNDQEAARLRDYLERGGFLMVDDFHGTQEWAGFVESMQRVFPDRAIVEVPENDPVMHVLYDLDERVQIPGLGALMSGRTYERDGNVPHWRGIYDDQGRLMVMIDFNMDLGDAWEHANTPWYPEEFTAKAYRYGINYIIYSMTH
jgi:hypothetical protein